MDENVAYNRMSVPAIPVGVHHEVDVAFNSSVITRIYNEFVVSDNLENAIIFSEAGVTWTSPNMRVFYNNFVNHKTPPTTNLEPGAPDLAIGSYYGAGIRYISLTVSAHTHPRNMYRHVSGVAGGTLLELQDISPPSIQDYKFVLDTKSPCHMIFASEGVWCIKTNIAHRHLMSPSMIDDDFEREHNSMNDICSRLHSQKYILSNVKTAPYIDAIRRSIGNEPFAINPQHASVIASNEYLNYRIQLYTYLFNHLIARDLITLTFHYYTTVDIKTNSMKLTPPIGKVSVPDPNMLLTHIPPTTETFAGATEQAEASGLLRVYAKAAGVAYSLYPAIPVKKIVSLPIGALPPPDAEQVPPGTLMYPLDARLADNMMRIDLTMPHAPVPENVYLVSEIPPYANDAAGACIFITPPAPPAAGGKRKRTLRSRTKHRKTRRRRASR